MLKDVFIIDTNCITPLGFDVASTVKNIEKGVTGIQLHTNKAWVDEPFYGALVDNETLERKFEEINSGKELTRLEKMMVLALEPIVTRHKNLLQGKTGLLISTTKGNITSLNGTQENLPENAYLQHFAKTIADFFGFTISPVVVSNACVSGILAVAIAKRLIRSDVYDHVFVVAGDEFSAFVLSGFKSFQALSDKPCKPYSKHRNGVSLGEATAAVLVTSDADLAKQGDVKILGDGAVNDANHISGPSRTGEGLFRSIESALKEADILPGDLNYISTHGTATPFNDEMEAIALNRLHLENVPVNSLKGYFGHTLGASGLLETVIAIETARRNMLYTSLGFDEPGVSQPINVIAENRQTPVSYFLKTASGFGGSNTAVIFEKLA